MKCLGVCVSGVLVAQVVVSVFVSWRQTKEGYRQKRVTLAGFKVYFRCIIDSTVYARFSTNAINVKIFSYYYTHNLSRLMHQIWCKTRHKDDTTTTTTNLTDREKWCEQLSIFASLPLIPSIYNINIRFLSRLANEWRKKERNINQIRHHIPYRIVKNVWHFDGRLLQYYIWIDKLN